MKLSRPPFATQKGKRKKKRSDAYAAVSTKWGCMPFRRRVRIEIAPQVNYTYYDCARWIYKSSIAQPLRRACECISNIIWKPIIKRNRSSFAMISIFKAISTPQEQMLITEQMTCMPHPLTEQSATWTWRNLTAYDCRGYPECREICQ